jgi:hypothetical protein
VKSPAKKSVPASQKPTPDMLVANSGTVFTFCPLTAQAGEWDERTNVGSEPWQSRSTSTTVVMMTHSKRAKAFGWRYSCRERTRISDDEHEPSAKQSVGGRSDEGWARLCRFVFRRRLWLEPGVPWFQIAKQAIHESGLPQEDFDLKKTPVSTVISHRCQPGARGASRDFHTRSRPGS